MAGEQVAWCLFLQEQYPYQEGLDPQDLIETSSPKMPHLHYIGGYASTDELRQYTHSAQSKVPVILNLAWCMWMAEQVFLS